MRTEIDAAVSIIAFTAAAIGTYLAIYAGLFLLERWHDQVRKRDKR